MSTKRLIVTVTFSVLSAWGLSCVSNGADPNVSQVDQEIAPAAPTNLTVTNNTNTFTPSQTLNWTPSAGAGSYLILRGTAGPGSETSYTTCCSGGPPFLANHLTAATQYCWEVEAIGTDGFSKSPPSNEVCLSTSATQTVPPPATVTALAVSSSRINVSWTSVTDATKYYVNQSVAGGAFTRIATVSAPGTSYPSIGLTPGTNYCYTIEAVTNYGQSVPSSPAACDSTFDLGLEGYWKLSESSGSTAADSSGFGRNLTLSGGATFSSTTPMAPIDPAAGNIEPHLDTDTTGVAMSSPSISAFRLVSDFSLTAWVYEPTAGNAQLMGMRSTGSCGTGAGWELSQTSSGLAFIGQTGTVSFGQSLTAGQWTHVAVTLSGSTMQLYVNGAQVASGTYTPANSLGGALQVGHVAGCAGAQLWLDEVQVYSRALSATEVATFGTRPPAPTALTLTKNCATAQGLSWTAPASGASRWIILRGVGPTASGNETHYTHAPNPPTTFNASHLTPNTQYAWEVETVQNSLISLPSNEVLATTPDLPPAPSGITATPNSQTRITVAWQAVTGASRYFVYMATTSAGPYTLLGSVAAPTVSFAATNLTANTTYWFEVQTEDACLSKGPMSAPVSATTLP